MAYNLKWKNGKKIILLLVLLAITLLLVLAFVIRNGKRVKYDINDLINISTLSDEFMDNYLEEVKNISKEDKENLLIVTSVKELNDTYGASKIIDAPNNQYILQFDSEKEKNDALKKLKKNKNIISAEQNVVLSTDTYSSEGYDSWAIELLGYDDAINSADTSSLHQVTVAVVDTGVQMSEFNKYYEGRVLDVYDYFDPNTKIEDLKDDKGHGTHVAGTIAEATPSNVKILPVRMADAEKTNNTMYLDDVVAAINNIAKNKMADVINMSLGSSELSEFPMSFYTAIAAANSQNIICVASAGNKNISRYHYPSAFDNTLSISAVDSHLEKAVFSNFGETVTFASPGWHIKNLAVDPEKRIKSGTSMSAPHASAAVAILKSYNIDLTMEQAVDLLKKYAIDIGDDGWDPYYGYGVINFNGAKFCNENVVCDEYNVFALDNTNTLSTIKITAPSMFTPDYNYGNFTNIMKAEINLYYDDNHYYTKNLEELINNIQIIGYEPFNYGIQDVIIKYNEFETTLKIDNTSLNDGWKYKELSDGSISLTEIIYDPSQLLNTPHDYTHYPKVIYIPDKIDGKEVTALSSGLFIDLDRMKRIVIPSAVKKIEQNVFGFSAENKLPTIGPMEVIIPESVEYIDNTNFNYQQNVILRTYKNSAGQNYAINNNMEYTYIESVDINLLKEEYSAFEKVQINDLAITVNYNGTSQSTETIKDGYTIKYSNGTDGFRYGDTSFTIIFDTDFGYHIEQEIEVNVIKATSEYTIPNNLTGTVGQKLSEIGLPDGFKWQDENVVFDKKGNLVFYARYTPLDTANYEVIDNIEIPVLVKGILISPEFNIKDKTYNGLSDIPLDNFVINNLDSSDYTITSYTLSSMNVGENNLTVVVRLSDEKFKTYSLEDDLQEREYTTSIRILPAVLEKPTLSVTKYTYTGLKQQAVIFNFDENIMNITGNYRTEAGKQDIIISLKNNNYVWSDNTYDDVTMEFIIDKAKLDVTYTSSNNIVEYDGKEHGINLNVNEPQNINISYMDENNEYTLTEMPKYNNVGEYTVRFRIYIDDNYTDIIDEAKIKIIKATIVNNSKDYEGFYDSMEHSIRINVNVDNYDIKYSVNNTDYNLSELPHFNEVGEYTINYKITAENYNDLIGSNKIKIYGIKSFDSSALIKDDIIIVRENIFLNITNKINAYAITTQFEHYDKNNTLIDDDITKTGDILKVKLNNEKNYIFNISIYGDINSDGSISSADYVMIRNHIMESEIIKDKIYFYAGDVNNDGKISSADYVRIRKYIMTGVGL